MNFPLYPNVDRIELSHSSQRTLAGGCEQKFHFAKLYQHPAKSLSQDPEEALRDLPAEVGHVLHHGFQTYFITQDREQAIWEMMNKYPIDICPDETNPRSLEACFSTLEKMFDDYSLFTYEMVEIDEKPAIEVPFQIRVIYKNFPLPIFYRGIIDFILYDPKTGDYLVVDIKTTRWWLKDKTPQYKFHEQCIPYHYILEIILGHQVESLTSLYLVTFVDIKEPKVELYDFPKTKYDLEDWARGLIIDIETIRSRMQMGWWRRNPDSCVAFNKVCPFFDICDIRDPIKIQEYLLGDQKPGAPREFNPWWEIDLELAG